MGLQTPQHTHAQTFLQGLLKGRKYHAARLVLFVLACLLISVAIFMLSFSNPQASRTQQLAANMIQTEARAEVLLIASYDDADSATHSGLNVAKEGAEELLWPTRCVLCDVPGTLLCEDCRLEIPYIDALHACPYCGQAYGKLACVDCNSFMVAHRQLTPDQRSRTYGDQGLPREGGVSPRGSEYATEAQGACMTDGPQRALDKVVSVFSFVDPCRKLITVYKDKKELRLAEVLAELLANYIDPSWVMPGETALVAIPARKQALRERGFDHMKEVGIRLSKRCGLPLLDILRTVDRSDQRGLSASSRQQNMKGSFAFNPQGLLCTAGVIPERVILVDDVLTTGATLMAAARVLKEASIEWVFGLTVARLP